MIRRVANCLVPTLLVFVVGCPQGAPPAEAVLEGRWSITPADPGEFEDFTYEGTFDSGGQLAELKATRDDGATATLDTAGSVTTLDGSDVTISVPGPGQGTRVFEGTLSEDQNTMTGSLTEEIDLGDLEVTVPGGDLTWDRI